MKKHLAILLLLTLFSCTDTAKNEEVNESLMDQSYFRHLNYLLQIKNETAKQHWKGFATKNFFNPAIYYTLDGTYAVQPNDHILKLSGQEKTHKLENFEFIALSEKYTDTTNFNFNNSYTESDSTALYYQANVLFFQSFGLTNKLIGVEDLQDWSIMVIHELFHGYQRQRPEFKAFYTQLDMPGGPDAFLAKYHKELEWYRESIEKENELLKAIWIEDADLKSNLTKYDSIRTLRINRIKNEYEVDIREAEDYEILLEGHARYFESLCKRYISKNAPNASMLLKDDLGLISGMFKGYEVKKDKNLSNIYNDRYYYPLGYNISMILEKYLPEYKETIYTEETNFNRYINTLKADNTGYK